MCVTMSCETFLISESKLFEAYVPDRSRLERHADPNDLPSARRCMIHLWESRQKGHWFGSRDSPYTACIGLSLCFFGRCCIFVPNDSPHFICLFVLLTISPKTCLSISLSALLPVPLWNCSSGHEGIICIEIFMHIHWHVRARTHTHTHDHIIHTCMCVCVWMYIYIYTHSYI